MKSKLVILAIGGNSLIKEKNRISLAWQYETLKETVRYITDLVQEGPELVITHGNGPQVGFIYRRGELARHELPLIPLDICGADTQGAIGYMLQKALLNEFRKRGISKKASTVVTQTLVDKDDPAFKNPSKPIGSFMTEQEAQRHRKESGWHIMEDAGRGFRRVVPSPRPKEIIELDVVQVLIKAGYIVIAGGGGGIPIIRNEEGDLEGVEAVIDKDLGSSLLGRTLGADTFIILTGVDSAYLNFGQKDQKPIRYATLKEMKRYWGEGHFQPGSMGPKVEAVIEFLEGGGRKAIITSPESLMKSLRGEAGTVIESVN